MEPPADPYNSFRQDLGTREHDTESHTLKVSDPEGMRNLFQHLKTI